MSAFKRNLVKNKKKIFGKFEKPILGIHRTKPKPQLDAADIMRLQSRGLIDPVTPIFADDGYGDVDLGALRRMEKQDLMMLHQDIGTALDSYDIRKKEELLKAQEEANEQNTVEGNSPSELDKGGS